MSVPNIPHISPHITLTRKQAKNLLLASIALEEIGLSSILNAESEQIKSAIAGGANVDELRKLNKNLNLTLRNVLKNQMLLQMKLEDVLKLPDCEEQCEHHHGGHCEE
jgi:hypothetical protein